MATSDRPRISTTLTDVTPTNVYAGLDRVSQRPSVDKREIATGMGGGAQRMTMPKLFSACLCLFLTMVGLSSRARAVDPNPGAPSGQLLQAPESAKMSETMHEGGASIGLYNCSNQQESTEKEIIACFFVLTRTDSGQYDYSLERIASWQPTLINNFHVEHKLVQVYILNGRGQRQSPINLDKGDRVWFAAEFADGADDITAARIVWGNGAQLRAPVKRSER
jgi:hypothetical protein